MARIIYAPATTGGTLVAQAVSFLIKAQELLARAKDLADSRSAGGATPANLETTTGPEFAVASGQGATFYTAIANMKTNAATVTRAALADLDMGG